MNSANTEMLTAAKDLLRAIEDEREASQWRNRRGKERERLMDAEYDARKRRYDAEDRLAAAVAMVERGEG